MKKRFLLILALLLSLSLAACRGAQQTPQPAQPQSPAQQSPVETQPQTPAVLPEIEAEPDDPEYEFALPDDDPETLTPSLPGTDTQPSETVPVPEAEPPQDEPSLEEASPSLDEHGSYTTKEDVALYLHLYGHLPENFITKKDAEALGWHGGSLEPYAPGMCIGGSRFGNYEGLLPEAKGRKYTECDIDTLGAKSRGAKRIVFSNDGLIYYTGDHYKSFELLYGEE